MTELPMRSQAGATQAKRVVKIYSDRSFIHPGTVYMDLLVPFWGSNDHGLSAVQPDRLKRYLEVQPSIVEMTSLEDCDFAVFPVEFQVSTGDRAHYLSDFVNLAHTAGKPVVTFIGGDLDTHPPFGDYFFHTALYRSVLKPNTFGMPPMIGDLLEEANAGEIKVRKKAGCPVLGFCGGSPPLATQWNRIKAKNIVRYIAYRLNLLKGLKQGCSPRTYALRVLRTARKIRTNFVIRGDRPVQFLWGQLVATDVESPPGVDSDGNTFQELANRSKVSAVRLEFIANLMESDYVLCARGFGNYSLRLYEALCCGRIPVIVNTDLVLPLEEVVDWKTLGVWVEEHEIGKIEQKILEFHERQTDESFREFQCNARKTWLEYLSPEGFFFHAFSYLLEVESMRKNQRND